jgi:hypothetical protein
MLVAGVLSRPPVDIEKGEMSEKERSGFGQASSSSGVCHWIRSGAESDGDGDGDGDRPPTYAATTEEMSFQGRRARHCWS